MKFIKSNQFSFFLRTAIVLLVPALLLSACDVTSSDDDDQEEHADPWGMALFMGGVEIAKQQPQVEDINYKDGDQIKLQAGEESSRIELRFLDEDGDYIDPDHLDEASSLGWDIVDEKVLQIEQHEEDGKWSFHFVGVEAGETQVVFHLLHGNHSDFKSMSFNVLVEE